ncbi:MAG: DUF711 family protein, partial [Anaerolineae bacterium]
MRIRSVTLGIDATYPLDPDLFRALGAFQEEARIRFQEAGLEVQTVRLATQPFPTVLQDEGPRAAAPFAEALEAACEANGIDYCSIGPVLATEPDADVDFIGEIPEVIRRTEAGFASVLVADPGAGINLEAISRSAEVVSEIAHSTPDGFGNLRLAILSNCGPGSPFFPVSYHGGGRTRFSVATEAADLAVEAFSGAATLEDAATVLTKCIDRAAQTIATVCEALEAGSEFDFGGIDFTLAPFPEIERSIGHAIELLGVEAFGGSATLFAVALIKRAIETASFDQCGFSGVMLPVLEDQTLAQRSVERLFSLDSLLLYSTVCGTGLDTI